MSLLQHQLEAIAASHLQQLVALKVAESRTIEYKRDPPSSSREAKREFLKDLSSFANALGGDLIYGIEEASSIPVALTGIADSDLDDIRQQLNNLSRDCIKPRLIGVEMKSVPVAIGRSCLVIRVPRSVTPPHVVDHERHWRFYGRNSAGAYPLAVEEVRAAVLVGPATADRARTFREERLARIEANQGPVKFVSGAKIVLHLLPFSAFDPVSPSQADLKRVSNASLFPLGNALNQSRYNLDGFLTWNETVQGPADTYAQLFRSGAVEAVAGRVMYDGANDRVIYLGDWERRLHDMLPRYLSMLKDVGVEAPLYAMVSLLGVQGSYTSGREERNIFSVPIEAEMVRSPEVVVDSLSTPVSQILRPIVDAFWNAAGLNGSPYFNAQGDYVGPGRSG